MGTVMLGGCVKFKDFEVINFKARQNFKFQARRISTTEF